VCRSPFACWVNKCDLPHQVGKLPSKRSTYPSAMQQVWTLKDKYPICTSQRPSEWVVADHFFTNLNDPGQMLFKLDEAAAANGAGPTNDSSSSNESDLPDLTQRGSNDIDRSVRGPQVRVPQCCDCILLWD
jgi:hypothetical protein